MDYADPKLLRALTEALQELLAAAGMTGGVLIGITPDGRAIVACSMPDPPEIEPAELLRRVLEKLEGGVGPGIAQRSAEPNR
jgi:hypothetical protein